MRKVLTVMLLVLLSAAFVSCNLEDANGSLQSGRITKSYTKARNQFHEVTGIYLPLLPDIEITEDSNQRTATWEVGGRRYTSLFEKPGRIMIDTELL